LTETSTPPAAIQPSRGLRWLLVVSLALNLLVAGAVLALWIKGPPRHGPHGPTQTAFGLLRFSDELPPERREAVRRHLRESRPELRALRGDLRTARSKAVDALQSPSFTLEEMKTALDAISAADGRLRDAGASTLLKAIGELTAEERDKLAQAWKRRLDREQRRKGKPGKDGSPDGPSGSP
jgi:uncharacterized membrane protein